jgi:hypothetical protein
MTKSQIRKQLAADAKKHRDEWKGRTGKGAGRTRALLKGSSKMENSVLALRLDALDWCNLAKGKQREHLARLKLCVDAMKKGGGELDALLDRNRTSAFGLRRRFYQPEDGQESAPPRPKGMPEATALPW